MNIGPGQRQEAEQREQVKLGSTGSFWLLLDPHPLAGLRPKQAVLSVTKEIAENKRWSWLSAEPWEGSAKAEPGACARLLSSSDYTFHDVWKAL